MFEGPRELSIKAESTGKDVKMTSTTIGTRNEVRVMFKTLSQALAEHRVITLQEQMAILFSPNIRAEQGIRMDLSTLVGG